MSTREHDDREARLADEVRARLLVLHPARSEWTESVVRPVADDVTKRLAPDRPDREGLARRIVDDLVGLGPLQPLMDDPAVQEILVNGPSAIFAERGGRLEPAPARFRDARHLQAVLERILALGGESAHEQRPHAEGSLPDGTRFHLVLPPMAPRGPLLSLRRFPARRLAMADLTGPCRTLPPALAELLLLAVRHRTPILVSGAAGAGKTTLLGALTEGIPADERVVTMETTAELVLNRPDWAALECVPPSAAGQGGATLRDLLRHALRLRPDRLIVGECLGAEAFDLLQAMNTGHEGVMTTVHAASAAGAVERLHELALTAGVPVPPDSLRRQLFARLGWIVHLARAADGTRRLMAVASSRGDSLVEWARRTETGWDVDSTWASPETVPPLLERGLAGPTLGRTDPQEARTGLPPSWPDPARHAALELLTSLRGI